MLVAMRKLMSLALQGGGSHGAFTAGVLDRLLEDERILFDGITGASAGAINAVLVAQGLVEGGSAGARAALQEFWHTLGQSPSAPVETLVALTRFLAPQQLNPLNLNPLRKLLSERVDFERLRRASPVRLFVSATDVASGMPRIFGTRELSLDVVLASACLPSLNQAVQIEGVAYWDGGLTANPPVRPLIYQCDAADVLVVLLQPQHAAIPTTADRIWARVNEIGFSSTLHCEIQGLALAKQAAEQRAFAVGRLERRLRRLNLHAIGPTEPMSTMDGMSRLKTDAAFLRLLVREGRFQAEAWLEAHFPSVGVRSTMPFGRHLRPAAA
ncbi:MAG: patatin-like phospholipase family protein [Burkholderiales bacterium]